MRIEVKGYGPARGKNAKDAREQTGTLIFKADNDVDAVQLAALAQGWTNNNKVLYRFRMDAVLAYAKKHNLAIVEARPKRRKKA